MASRNDPALRTCSQVRVVRLAVPMCQYGVTWPASTRARPALFCGILTAKRSNGRVDGLDKDAVAVDLWRRLVSLCSWNKHNTAGRKRNGSKKKRLKSCGCIYLVTVLGIQQNPTKLDDFCRVLGDIDTMLVTRRGHMDDHIAVDVAAWSLRGSHCAEAARTNCFLRRCTKYPAVGICGWDDKRG